MSESFVKYDEAIHDVNEVIDLHFKKITEILSDNVLLEIFREHNKIKEEQENAGFNIFNLITEKYYYENLHSDIICEFLKINGGHKEQGTFLKIFIELLNNNPLNLAINYEDFKNSSAKREENRIDILIQDERTNKAIIIENKINNATDTYRQLPKYINEIGEENIAAIVYLPLDPYKRPNEEDWEQKEINFIHSKLIILPAYNRIEKDFYKGWLELCIQNAKNSDVKCILKQYSFLIKKIGGDMMDMLLYKKFYDKIISDNEYFETSLSIKNFVENLYQYRAQRIYESYLNNFHPFKKIRQEYGSVCFEGYTNSGRNFVLKLECTVDHRYQLRFWDAQYDKMKNDEPINNFYTSKIVKALKERGVIFENESEAKDEYVNWYLFPHDDKKIFAFLDNLKVELKNLSPDICLNNI